jgi:hypothetical protein
MLDITQPMDVTITELARDWKQLKALIKDSINRDEKEEAFRLLKALGYIGYRYNFLKDFVDDDADDLILQTYK